MPFTCGFFIVDKPAGMTSHTVVNRVRRIAGTRRVGHAGTLDPAATGVLVVAFGLATRYLEYIAADEKAYAALVRLGIRTDSYDLDGTVLSECDPSSVSEANLRAALALLTGTIRQIPPMVSALKLDGQPLHKLARKGMEVLRAPREVTVRELELIRFAPPDAELRVVCSKGTYVRSLAHDLGEYLAVGAALAGLRRTRSGRFGIEDAVPLEALKPEHARPLDEMLAHLPEVALGDADALRFCHGNKVECRMEAGLVRVKQAGELHGVGEVVSGRLHPRKVLAEDGE